MVGEDGERVEWQGVRLEEWQGGWNGRWNWIGMSILGLEGLSGARAWAQSASTDQL